MMSVDLLIKCHISWPKCRAYAWAIFMQRLLDMFSMILIFFRGLTEDFGFLTQKANILLLDFLLSEIRVIF